MSGLNFSKPRCVLHQATFPLAASHNKCFPDGNALYYSESTIHQDPIAARPDRHTISCGTSPDKIHSGSFYGNARRYR